NAESRVRKAIGIALVLSANPAQCMKRYRQRYAALLAYRQRGKRRHEEVGMNNIVGLLSAGNIVRKKLTERLHMRKQLFLGKIACRSGRDVNNANITVPVHLRRQRGTVQPGKNVDPVPKRRKLPGDLPYVNILASAVDASNF